MGYITARFEGKNYEIKISRDIKKCIVCGKTDRFIESEELEGMMFITCSCSTDKLVDWYYIKEKKLAELKKFDRTV